MKSQNLSKTGKCSSPPFPCREGGPGGLGSYMGNYEALITKAIYMLLCGSLQLNPFVEITSYVIELNKP
jgi:hypothetical protein